MPQAHPTAKAAVVEPIDPKAGMLEMVQVVENKKRNLEKRKQKLEALQSKPDAELTEQQREAITHIGEVNGNIQYVEEILVRFREVQAQVDKWLAIEAKKEKIASLRNKKGSKKNGETIPTQRDEPTGTDPHTETIPDAASPSRSSVCDTPPAAVTTENDAASQNVPSSTSVGEDTSEPAAAPAVVPEINDEVNHVEDADAAVSQQEDGVVVSEDGVAPKETVTFVNSQTGAETDAQAPADGERVHSGFGGRPYSGPRRDYRPYHDGPRGAYAHGQSYGRPPRRGRGGPFRGGRGPYRGGSSNTNAHAPQATATS